MLLALSPQRCRGTADDRHLLGTDACSVERVLDLGRVRIVLAHRIGKWIHCPDTVFEINIAFCRRKKRSPVWNTPARKRLPLSLGKPPVAIGGLGTDGRNSPISPVARGATVASSTAKLGRRQWPADGKASEAPGGSLVVIDVEQGDHRCSRSWDIWSGRHSPTDDLSIALRNNAGGIGDAPYPVADCENPPFPRREC